MHSFQVIRLLNARRASRQSHPVLLLDHELEFLGFFLADFAEREEEEADSQLKNSDYVGILEGGLLMNLKMMNLRLRTPKLEMKVLRKLLSLS